MKAKQVLLLALLAFCTLPSALSSAQAQGTLFTYQGQLQNNGNPANGNYDFGFSLYDAPSLGALVGSPVTNKDVAVSNGVFTTVIDFGAAPWTGQALYLEILIRTNGNGAFNALNPLQPITATPYSITASNLTGTLSAGQLSGTLPISQVGGILPSSQLPAGVLTNTESGITLSGSFTGNGGSLTNIPLTGLATGGTLGLGSNGPGFTVAGNIIVGNGPYLVIPATNLNGTGRVDLVVPNALDNTLSVLTNTGAGGFVTSATIHVGLTPYCVAVADLNNDGKPDLANVNYGSGTVTILFNTGGGQFFSNQTVAVGTNPGFIAAVPNLSGSGKTGLIVANEGDNTITVLTNNGSGIMTSNATLAVGVNPFGIAVADVNGDGKPDVIVANFGGTTLNIFTNNGLGAFGSNAVLTVGNQPEPVVAVDVNHDGWVDLVCANRDDYTLTVLTNNHGVFTLASTVQLAGSARVLAVGDFNSDGQPDLVCGDNVDGLQIVFNTGNGTFAPAPFFQATPAEIGLRGVAVLDVNGDGQPDLVSSAYNTNYLVEIFYDPGLPSADLTLQNGGLRLVTGWSGVPNIIGGYASNLVDATINGSVIAGGGSISNFNHISSDESSIGGGEGNTIQPSADHTVIGGGAGNSVQLYASYSDIGGGLGNTIGTNSPYSVISGGEVNTVQPLAFDSFIGGGGGNVILGNDSFYSVIAGGQNNTNGGDSSAIGGGYFNSIQGALDAVIGGGYNNIVQESGNETTIGGGTDNTIGTNAQNATIGGGADNLIGNDANSATIGGGAGNAIQTNVYASIIGGGNNNSIQPLAQYSTIGGGSENTIGTNAQNATIGGGTYNYITPNGWSSTIAGGWNNSVQNGGSAASIGGGQANSVTGSGSWSTIPGGYANVAAGQFSFAAGQYAQANHNGAFVWSDASSSSPFSSVTQNEFAVRATGGVRFVTSGAGLTVDGQAVVTANTLASVALLAGGNTFTGLQTIYGNDAVQLRLQNSADNRFWSVYDEHFNGSGALIFQPDSGTGGYISRADGNYHINSDVRLKRDITPLDGMLARLLQLRPVSYHFRSAPEGTPLTLGLIAQEVEPLFPEVVGERHGIKSLAYSELIPVTVRAIQELNQKLNEKDAEIESLKEKAAKVDSIEKRLTELEHVIQLLAERK